MFKRSKKMSFLVFFCKNVYCIDLWYSFSQSVLNKFRVCYNNSFRILNDFPKYYSASDMFFQRNILSFTGIWRHDQWTYIKSFTASDQTTRKG